MAVQLARRVDFPMIDSAQIAYYPRIYDLAHRFFEECWELMCGITYPALLNERRIGFPVVHIETKFVHPLRYGDTVHASVELSKIGSKSCTWEYIFSNQNNEIVWQSTQVTVCVDMDSLESQTIPSDVKEGLLQHLRGPSL